MSSAVLLSASESSPIKPAAPFTTTGVLGGEIVADADGAGIEQQNEQVFNDLVRQQLAVTQPSTDVEAEQRANRRNRTRKISALLLSGDPGSCKTNAAAIDGRRLLITGYRQFAMSTNSLLAALARVTPDATKTRVDEAQNQFASSGGGLAEQRRLLINGFSEIAERRRSLDVKQPRCAVNVD